MAHEIGHFLGMKHDFVEVGFGPTIPRKHKGKVCTSKSHLMTYNPDLTKMVEWSPCSKADFQAYYLYATSYLKWCMEGNILKDRFKNILGSKILYIHVFLPI